MAAPPPRIALCVASLAALVACGGAADATVPPLLRRPDARRAALTTLSEHQGRHLLNWVRLESAGAAPGGAGQGGP